MLKLRTVAVRNTWKQEEGKKPLHFSDDLCLSQTHYHVEFTLPILLFTCFTFWKGLVKQHLVMSQKALALPDPGNALIVPPSETTSFFFLSASELHTKSFSMARSSSVFAGGCKNILSQFRFKRMWGWTSGVKKTEYLTQKSALLWRVVQTQMHLTTFK